MKRFLRSFSSLPLIHSRRVVVSYKRKYVHELLVNRLFKPAQESLNPLPLTSLTLKILWKMEHMLFCSKGIAFYNIFKSIQNLIKFFLNFSMLSKSKNVVMI